MDKGRTAPGKRRSGSPEEKKKKKKKKGSIGGADDEREASSSSSDGERGVGAPLFDASCGVIAQLKISGGASFSDGNDGRSETPGRYFPPRKFYVASKRKKCRPKGNFSRIILHYSRALSPDVHDEKKYCRVYFPIFLYLRSFPIRSSPLTRAIARHVRDLKQPSFLRMYFLPWKTHPILLLSTQYTRTTPFPFPPPLFFVHPSVPPRSSSWA